MTLNKRYNIIWLNCFYSTSRDVTDALIAYVHIVNTFAANIAYFTKGYGVPSNAAEVRANLPKIFLTAIAIIIMQINTHNLDAFHK